MNKKEELKFKVVNEVVTGTKDKKLAVQELGISMRQLNRLIKNYKEEGKSCFIHKNKGQKSKKKTEQELIDYIINLYLTEYSDYNFAHFYDEIKDEINISYSTIFRALTENEIISPEAQHSTVNTYNTNMKQAIKKGIVTKEKENLFNQRIEEEKKKHIRLSTNLLCFGEELQTDATFGYWFGNIVTALHLIVDKATKKVLYGWFDYQETTEVYLILLYNTIAKYGIPKLIRTDKRGTFSVNNVRCTSKLNTTQFGRICNDLGIILESSSSATFKPNVERENKTFKGRLIAELRHENITTIEEAIRYLNEVFIPKMNAKFSYEIYENRSLIKPCDFTNEELNIIVSLRYERKIDNASSIKYKNEYYIPIDVETNEFVSKPMGTICTVVLAYDKTLWCFIDDILYKLYKIEKQPKIVTEKAKKTQEKINKSKAHKPAENHPWRNYKN